MSELINHVLASLEKTNNYDSKINDDILNIYGMSGKKNKHLINNLCSMDNTRYLHLGLWQGSSFIPALYNNTIDCVGIDNWSTFGNVSKEFFVNLNKYKNNNNVEIIENDCWSIDNLSLNKINILNYHLSSNESDLNKLFDTFHDYLDELKGKLL